MVQEQKVKYAGIDAVKSAKRVAFVNELVKALSAKDIYKYSLTTEKDFVIKVSDKLKKGIFNGYKAEYSGKDESWIKEKAEASLIEELNKEVTVNHTQLFGTQHRPDMFVLHDEDYRIAIEYKLVEAGNSIREAIGQGIVYASEYEFTILVLLDTTKDQKIKRSITAGSQEAKIVDYLWETFNIRLLIVGPTK